MKRRIFQLQKFNFSFEHCNPNIRFSSSLLYLLKHPPIGAHISVPFSIYRNEKWLASYDRYEFLMEFCVKLWFHHSVIIIDGAFAYICVVRTIRNIIQIRYKQFSFRFWFENDSVVVSLRWMCTRHVNIAFYTNDVQMLSTLKNNVTLLKMPTNSTKRMKRKI